MGTTQWCTFIPNLPHNLLSGVTLLWVFFFFSKLRQPPPHPPFLQALQDTTLWYRGPQWCHNDVGGGGGGASRHSFIQSHQFSGRVMGLRECIHIKAMLSNSPHARLGTGVKTSSKGLASIYAHAAMDQTFKTQETPFLLIAVQTCV